MTTTNESGIDASRQTGTIDATVDRRFSTEVGKLHFHKAVVIISVVVVVFTLARVIDWTFVNRLVAGIGMLFASTLFAKFREYDLFGELVGIVVGALQTFGVIMLAAALFLSNPVQQMLENLSDAEACFGSTSVECVRKDESRADQLPTQWVPLVNGKEYTFTETHWTVFTEPPYGGCVGIRNNEALQTVNKGDEYFVRSRDGSRSSEVFILEKGEYFPGAGYC